MPPPPLSSKKRFLFLSYFTYLGTTTDWTGLDWTATRPTPTLGFFSINTRSIRCFARFLLGTYLTVDADVSISTSV